MNHKELAAAIAAAQSATSAAVAGDCNGQYPAEAIDAYKQALTAAEAVNSKADDQLTQAEIDAATNALKQAAATFNAARFVIDLSALKASISAAQETLSNAQDDRGDGPGKIPENAFTALQTELTKAQTMANENKVNQATVDAETATLNAAIETFRASRIANDYATLKALVDEATQLVADAEAGKIEFFQEDLDELKASLEKNAAALESTDQDVIDRAVKLLRRDIALFRNLTDGVTTLGSNLATIHLFDLNGRPVTTSRRNLSRGTYVMVVEADGKKVTRKISVK